LSVLPGRVISTIPVLHRIAQLDLNVLPISFLYGLKIVRFIITPVHCKSEGPAGCSTFPVDTLRLQLAVGRKILKVVLILKL